MYDYIEYIYKILKNTYIIAKSVDIPSWILTSAVFFYINYPSCSLWEFCLSQSCVSPCKGPC